PQPGSTQEHINAQFGMASTPQPISLAESQDSRSTAPTLLFPADGKAVTSTAGKPDAGQAVPSPHGTQPTLILPEDLRKTPVAAPPPAAPVQPAAAAPAAGEPGPPKPAPARKQRGKQPPWLWVGSGAGVVIVVLALIVGKGLVKPRAAAVATPVPTAAAPEPQPTAEPAAQAAAQATAPAKSEVTPADLERALTAGNVDRIRTMLAGLSNEERAAIGASPDGARRLEVARRAVEADSALAKAVKSKDPQAVVERAGALLSLVSSNRPAQQARDAAAAALEAESDALLHKGQTDAALAKLQGLQHAWTDRPGLDARLAGVRAARDVDQRLAAVLATADAAEKERRPEKGLEALAQVTPEPRWQERFAAARHRLEALLSELDKAPPSARLKPGSKMDYSKGKPFTVSVIVTDDYRVKSVTVMARQEGAADYQALPARAGGDDEYTVDITPEFHGNKTVELYVVAMDYAGHTSQLGSPEQPLHFKKRWLF
ncbi:MAG TPA: hypothetical protein VMT19_01245, partial [Thermoanaerobaculaceae bacterium]|nr:hypothetical protein [Thermoanaerobaculaceae bacterium]